VLDFEVIPADKIHQDEREEMLCTLFDFAVQADDQEMQWRF
jgi:hypothetical protein